MEDLLGWFLVFIFLISLLGILSYQGIGFCFCCIYLTYAITYRRRQHLVDVTEIYQLNREKKQQLYKFGYLIILLVLFIFWLLWTAGKDHH